MTKNFAGDPSGRNWVRTAKTLAEALPHIQRHGNRVVVIKLGGAAVGDEEARKNFALDVTLLRQCDIQTVVVHGGGPQISGMLDRLGIEARFVGGQRVTDSAAMEVVEMVLAGSINKNIVSEIRMQGGRAVGISGKDGNLLCAVKRESADGSDLGFVGTPAEMDTRILDDLIASEAIPVIAPVAFGADGETYNINADTAAGAIASAMRAARLLLLTDVEGVLDADGRLLRSITAEEAARLIDDGTIGSGMIPKVRTACDAVESGVRAAVILDGRTPHATLLELFTDRGAGTLISEQPR